MGLVLLVGLVGRTSLWGGVPDVFVPLRDAQDLALRGLLTDEQTAHLDRAQVGRFAGSESADRC